MVSKELQWVEIDDPEVLAAALRKGVMVQGHSRVSGDTWLVHARCRQEYLVDAMSKGSSFRVPAWAVSIVQSPDVRIAPADMTPERLREIGHILTDADRNKTARSLYLWAVYLAAQVEGGGAGDREASGEGAEESDPVVDTPVLNFEDDVKNLIAAGINAFQHTREYVGSDTLPAREGWSWFDWVKRAESFLTHGAGGSVEVSESDSAGAEEVPNSTGSNFYQPGTWGAWVFEGEPDENGNLFSDLPIGEQVAIENSLRERSGGVFPHEAESIPKPDKSEQVKVRLTVKMTSGDEFVHDIFEGGFWKYVTDPLDAPERLIVRPYGRPSERYEYPLIGIMCVHMDPLGAKSE